jgi:hypothetical protein
VEREDREAIDHMQAYIVAGLETREPYCSIVQTEGAVRKQCAHRRGISCRVNAMTAMVVSCRLDAIIAMTGGYGSVAVQCH